MEICCQRDNNLLENVTSSLAACECAAEKTEVRKNATKDPFDLPARRLCWSAPPQASVVQFR